MMARHASKKDVGVIVTLLLIFHASRLAPINQLIGQIEPEELI